MLVPTSGYVIVKKHDAISKGIISPTAADNFSGIVVSQTDTIWKEGDIVYYTDVSLTKDDHYIIYKDNIVAYERN